MSAKTIPTRRGFLKGSALAAAPLAMAPAAAIAGDNGRARLEDEVTIRRLQQDFLRQVNLAGGHERLDGAVRAITADPMGGGEEIILSADGRRASARLASLAEIETQLARDSTLAQMAHAQGTGAMRRTERRMLTIVCARTRDGWAIEKATLV